MKKGFTIVEFLVVVAILGIVAMLIIGGISSGISNCGRFSQVDNKPPQRIDIPKSFESPEMGESIPIKIHGMQYTIIYSGPDNVQIYRQKECEDATVSPTDRAGDKTKFP